MKQIFANAGAVLYQLSYQASWELFFPERIGAVRVAARATNIRLTCNCILKYRYSGGGLDYLLGLCVTKIFPPVSIRNVCLVWCGQD